ncbi:MAG: hypothetical protein K2P81_17800 [Bacteriovoracaceae bacterium]|nr:hypothetical protein [Bacteriovoracaceae bacterium]
MTAENNIVIVGFGNQAKAWCANLHDSGFKVHVLLRHDSKSRSLIPKDFKILDWQAPMQGHPMAFLVPDHEIAGALASLSAYIPAGTTLYYAHGFALIEEKLNEKFPQFNHVLLAPKAIGTEVRATYVDRRALGGVYSVEMVHEDERKKIEALTLKTARALGITWGPYAVGVKQEMQADLFSEQAVLCSVIPEACRISFNMLIEKGIPPELAYFELWHEVGLIVKVMVDKGPEAFFHLISPNALIGAEKGRTLLCNEPFAKNMKTLLSDIESGKFAKEAASTDVEKLRHDTVLRWKNDPFGKTIEKMQKERP